MRHTYHHAAGALTVAGMAMAGASVAAGSFGDPRDVREITALENQMASATNIDQLMPHFADDAILIDIMAPGWYQGREQIRAAIAPQLAPIKTLKYRMHEISVATDGTLACAAMQLSFDVTRQDNSPLKMSVRQIDAFRKIHGQWRIIQQHVSVPVDQKGSTAVLDAPVASRGALPWSENAAPGPGVSVDQARKEIASWLTASEIPKSLDEMQVFYNPGSDFLIFDWWSPREVRGHDEVRDYYGPQFDAIRDMQVETPVVHIETDGRFGVQVSQQHLTMNIRDGSSQSVSFRQSDCVRRVDGHWYSFFEMGSFPIDAGTGKAITAQR
jgi:ketosteroid isomerase-like protein